jgi:hypothetical protein
MLAGLVARICAAYFVYGPQALDDYKHGVYPAYQYFAGLPLDLPDYRSHILIWLLSFFLRIGHWFGVESALAQVRTMYLGLGVFSLIGIWGTYLFVRNYRSKTFGVLALYLIALFPLMPFVSTRAFGEAVAMNIVLLAFGLLESARRNVDRPRHLNQQLSLILGFFLLGLGTYFRFHVGILYFTYVVSLFVSRRYYAVFLAVFTGMFVLAGQLLIDRLSAKVPMGTLLAYLEANGGGAAQYGVSPWYNTWAFFLSLTLAPFSFVLAKRVCPFLKREWPWVLPMLIYVLIHSLVPHKEERFLYPIVGLELWSVAWLWASLRFDKWTRRLYAPVLLTVSLILLPMACLINTQEGEIEPPAYAEKRFHNVVYLDHQSLFSVSRIRFYFLRAPSVLKEVSSEELSLNAVEKALIDYPESKAVVLLTSIPEEVHRLKSMAGESTQQSRCETMRTAGSLIDRLIYRLNPEHNQRRRPTWYLVCARGS